MVDRVQLRIANMRYIITEDYIKSHVYKKTIMKHTDEYSDFYHQEKNQKNFNYRHANLQGLGAWKWLCTFKHKNIIAKYVFSHLKGIDFGGASAPIWGNTEIIDIYPPKMYRQLHQIKDEELDYIFTSHTLEHIENLDNTLFHFNRVLKKDGILIVFVPCFTCERWRAGSGLTSHVHTFDMGDFGYTDIKSIIEEHDFEILEAEYTWDNSIFILGVKK